MMSILTFLPSMFQTLKRFAHPLAPHQRVCTCLLGLLKREVLVGLL